MRLPLIRAAVLLTAWLATLASCGDGTGPERAGPPASLQVVSGDAQTDTVGQELAQALVVKVLDDDGDPVPNAVVNFVVVAGGGSVFAGAAQTNAEGVAQERWTLGTSTADSQKVEVRAVDATTGAPRVFGVFRATAVADAPASATRTVIASAPAGAALPDSVAVIVRDRHDNPVAGAPVAWSVVLGGGTIAGSGQTGADGVARAAWTLGPSVGAQEARAVVAALPAVALSVTATMPVGLGLTRAGEGQTAVAGQPLAQPLVVFVRTPGGQPLAGVPVSWIVTAGSGAVVGDAAVTDANGRASAHASLGTAAGAQGYRAVLAGGQATVDFDATATASAPVAVQAGALPTAVAPGAVVRPSVTVRDMYGNVVPDATVAWAVTGGGGSVSPASSATGADGKAETAWTLGPSAGANTATATVAGLGPVALTVTSTPPPTAPTGLRATVSGPDRILVAWNAVHGATSYRLYWGVDGAPPTNVVPSLGVFHEHAGRTKGATYTYAVASVGPTGEGAQSAPVTATIGAGAFTVEISTPAAGASVGDDLVVVAGVTSQYALAGVTASVDGREAALVRRTSTRWPGGGWEGVISLRGLAPGAKQVTVTARDVAENAGSAAAAFVYDEPPRLAFAAPAEGAVVPASVRVVASCTDADSGGCTSLALSARPDNVSTETPLATGTTSIDHTVALPGQPGQRIKLVLRGRNAQGVESLLTRDVYIASTAGAVQEVARTTGRVLDALDTRVLHLEESTGTLRVLDRTTGADVVVATGIQKLVRGLLTPSGAVYATATTLGLNKASNLYEWRGGAVAQIGVGPERDAFLVAGNYVAWIDPTQGTGPRATMRRDVVAGVTIEVGPGNTSDVGVAANGDVAFLQHTDRSALVRYRDGVLTTLIPGSDLSYKEGTATDGTNVLLLLRNMTSSDSRLRIIGPTTGDLTSGIGCCSRSGQAAEGDSIWVQFQNHRLNDGWAAWSNVGTLALRVLSPTGQSLSVPGAGAGNAVLEALGPDGEVVFRPSGTADVRPRYLWVPGDAAPRDLGTAGKFSRAVFRDGKLYVMLGNTLSEVAY